MENLTWSYCVGEKAKEGKNKFNVLPIADVKGSVDSYFFIWKKRERFPIVCCSI